MRKMFLCHAQNKHLVRDIYIYNEIISDQFVEKKKKKFVSFIHLQSYRNVFF